MLAPPPETYLFNNTIVLIANILRLVLYMRSHFGSSARA